MQSNTHDLRELLNRSFSDEELTVLSYDYFRPVHDMYASGMNRLVKIQLLIDHCERHNQLGKLLELITANRPQQRNGFVFSSSQALQTQVAFDERGSGRFYTESDTLPQVQVTLDGDLSDFTSEQRMFALRAAAGAIAAVLGIPRDQIIIRCDQDGSITLHLDMPIEAGDRLLLLHDNDDPAARALGVREVTTHVSRSPLYSLARQVLQGKLTFSAAQEQARSERVLAGIDDLVLDQLNQFCYTWGRQDPRQATILAVLTCEAARHKGSDALWGDCNSTLGWLYLRQDRLDSALGCYREALKALEPLPRAQEAVARIRLEMGEIRERQGDLEAAAQVYGQVVELGRQLGRPALECDAHTGLGNVYLAGGQAEAARGAYQRALEVSRRAQDRYGEAAALANLGRVDHFLGRLQEATDRYQEAVDLSKRIGPPAATGRSLGLLGSVLAERGRLDEAEQCLQGALEIALRLGDRPGMQERLGNLGNLHRIRAEHETDPGRRKARLDKAQDHHRQALEIARERNDRRSQAEQLAYLGHVYREQGRFQDAQTGYADSLSLANEQGMADLRWRVHYAWGRLHSLHGRPDPALDHFETAIRIVEEQRNELTIPSRVKFWQERSALYRHMVLCRLQRGEPWLALAYTERARARYLADLLSQRTTRGRDPRESDGPALEPVQETLKGVQAAVDDLPAATAVVVFSVTEAGTAVFIVTAQAKEGPATLAVDGWQRSPDGRIRATVIKSFDQRTLQRMLIETDGSGRAIGGYLVDYYRDWNRWLSSLESVTEQLYVSLLASVQGQLEELMARQVVLMPNLGLGLLPLHACGTAKDRLLDRYSITYAPSFGVLARCQARERRMSPGPRSLFTVANPTGDLPWAGIEAASIARLFPKKRVLGSSAGRLATEKAVMREAPGYSAVHLATHARFELIEPLRSRLRLANRESLTLETILDELVLPRTRLVVMSACETGLMDPGDLADEYVGLPAAFIQAGSPSVVSSLWRVSDISTALLMERFYEHLLGRGVDRTKRAPLPHAEALRQAQIWLRDRVTARDVHERCQSEKNKLERRGLPIPEPLSEACTRYAKMADQSPDRRLFAHPVYWAAFTLSGASPSPAAAPS